MVNLRGRLVCGNLFIFPGMFGNVLTFPCLVGDLKPHSREYCIPGKEFHPQNITTSPHGNPTFPWEGNVCHCKKTKIPLSSPKATRHRSPPTTAATAGRPPPPQPAAVGHPPSPPAGHLPPPPSRVFLEICQLFPGIQFAYQTLLKYHTRESYSRK